jgi:hypothetical protein
MAEEKGWRERAIDILGQVPILTKPLTQVTEAIAGKPAAATAPAPIPAPAKAPPDNYHRDRLIVEANPEPVPVYQNVDKPVAIEPLKVKGNP